MTRPKLWPDPQTADPLAEPTIHRRVWSAYLARGLTRASFAREMKVDYSTAFNWDMGKATPDLLTFLRICTVVKYTPNEMAYGHGAAPGDERKAMSPEAVGAIWRESGAPFEASMQLGQFKQSPMGVFVFLSPSFVRAYFAAFGEAFDRARDNADDAHAHALTRAAQADALAHAITLGAQPITGPAGAAKRKRKVRKRKSTR